MARLEALKKLRYPRGPDGKEYDPGGVFEASDRDAHALKLVRAAKDASAEPQPIKRQMQAVEPEQPAKRGPGRPRKNPGEESVAAVPASEVSPSYGGISSYGGIYGRRDMRSED